MAPLLFGWPMVLDDATLSGGSWQASLPITNLQTDALGAVARSSDALAASSLINIDFGAAQAVSVVALVRHNLQKDATWRIRGSAAADMSAPVYDSGSVAVWSYQWATGVLPSGHPNAATRLLTNAQIAALNPARDAVHVLATEASARYWRVELIDTTNTAGYVQAGRLVCAPRLQPTYQFEPGATFGFDDGSSAGHAFSRVRYYDARSKGRTLSLAFPMVTDAVAVTVLRDMVEALGIDGQVYVVMDPDATTTLQRTAFLANLRSLSGVQYAAAGYGSFPMVLDEVL